MLGPITNTNLYNPALPGEYAKQSVIPGQNESGQMTVGKGNGPDGVCLTCKSRRYQDVSSDGGVSFQTPTHISPEASFSAVRAHEYEHIRRDRAAAEERGDEIVFQNVSFRVSTCDECGKAYKSGGTATTVSRTVSDKRPEPYGDFVDEYV